MRILEVSRYKNNFANHQLPFVTEQGEAIAQELRKLDNGHLTLDNGASAVEYFLVKGNYVTAVRELKKKIREFKPDIVHAHYGLSAITAELQGLVPVVTTFHNGETLNRSVNLMSSLMSLRAKHVIYVAQHIRDLSYFKAKNYSIIPCGVPMDQMNITTKEEARKQLGWSDDKKYILFGGAFSNLRKNYPLLRDAVELLEENKNIDKHCCAEINNENNIDINKKDIKKNEELSDTFSIPNNLDQMTAQEQALGQSSAQSCSIDSVAQTRSNNSSQKMPKNAKNIWTPINDGEQYGDIVCIEMKGLSRAECVLRMCACDLFALPSHSEGSPQALKEAMACNCPCIATDIADVRELFGDEPGHWILRNPRKTHERWDGDEKSLDEMVKLLNEALKYKGRTRGRERILELGLSNEQVAKRTIAIYNAIIKKEK